VVFSFFKKDAKESKRPAKSGAARPIAPPPGQMPKPIGKPLAGPVNRSLNNPSSPAMPFATTENALPDRELARSLAMETAAKIDAIESEMARDFLRHPDTGGGFSNSAANSTLQRPSQQQQPAAAPAAGQAPDSKIDDSFDAGADVFAGNADAIELLNEGSGSVLEEAAILFANEQEAAAEAVLRTAIDSDTLGPAAQIAWLMLFELVQQRGDKAAFEQLTMNYVLRFENSAPAWVNYQAAVPEARPVAANALGPVVRLPESVDANIVKPLEQLKALAQQHAALTLDVSATRGVDLVGAELLLRVINAFKRASHELLILGAEQLLNPLRAAIEPGRRDASDAAWMLLLEVQRLLGKQNDFEETGIQYCITFEVSPPSWEAPPPNLKTRAAPAAPAAAAAADPLDWRGVILGEGEPHFGRLAAVARTEKNLSVDCLYLRRMAFSAASALLGVLIRLQQGGASIEFRNVNCLVAELFKLLGISAVATVQPRRV
jgi:anti-anti-sigma regulatory factor